MRQICFVPEHLLCQYAGNIELLPLSSPREVGMFSALQLKAARSLAGWSREELAERSGVAAETIKRFELRGSDPKVSTLLKLRRALASVGIEFTDAADGRGEGVRFKTDSGAAPLAKKRTPASTKLPRSK